MKLNKDQKQKLLLGGMIVVGVIYAFSEFILGPLSTAQTAAQAESSALDPKIGEAKAYLAKVAALRAKEPDAKLVMDQVKSLIPSAAPIAWFPPRVAGLFKKYKVENVVTRMNSEVQEKELPGFRRLNWGVEAAKVDFMSFAAAVAAFENEEPLVEIQSVDVEAGREDVGSQRAAFNLTNIVNQ